MFVCGVYWFYEFIYVLGFVCWFVSVIVNLHRCSSDHHTPVHGSRRLLHWPRALERPSFIRQTKWNVAQCMLHGVGPGRLYVSFLFLFVELVESIFIHTSPNHFPTLKMGQINCRHAITDSRIPNSHSHLKHTHTTTILTCIMLTCSIPQANRSPVALIIVVILMFLATRYAWVVCPYVKSVFTDATELFTSWVVIGKY